MAVRPMPASSLKDIDSRGLTEVQLEAAYLMGDGAHRAEVARKVGVDTRTIAKWANHPRFQEVMESARTVDRYNLKGAAVALQGSVLQKLQAAVDANLLSHAELIKLLTALSRITGTTDPVQIQHSGVVSFDLSGLSGAQLDALATELQIVDTELADDDGGSPAGDPA